MTTVEHTADLTGDGTADGPLGVADTIARAEDIPDLDISALTSRIATLESQVSALTATATPAATGLTAEQLDSRYMDGYDIIKVGTPARSNETEEPSHE